MTNPFAISTLQLPSGEHGLAVNASGTRLAAAKPMTPGGRVDLTDPTLDASTLIPNGGEMWLDIRSAIAMGILRRTGSTIIETCPPTGSGPW